MLRDIDQPYIFGIKTGTKQFQFQFFDTSSPDNWRTLDPDAIVICYDISQRLSLINMQRYVSAPTVISWTKDKTADTWQWIDEVKRSFQRFDTLPLIILGLKRDLRSEDDPNGIIYPQEAYTVAQALRADRYVECSAVTGELLKLAFEDLCKTAVTPTTGTNSQSASTCAIM
jgi:Ras family protein A